MSFARFINSGQFAFLDQPSEAVTADTEETNEASGATAKLTAVVIAG